MILLRPTTVCEACEHPEDPPEHWCYANELPIECDCEQCWPADDTEVYPAVPYVPYDGEMSW